MATIYLVPLALIIEQPYQMTLPSWSAIGALVTLAAMGTALAFVIYYRIMEAANATSLSMVTYMVPIVGTILGCWCSMNSWAGTSIWAVF